MSVKKKKMIQKRKKAKYLTALFFAVIFCIMSGNSAFAVEESGQDVAAFFHATVTSEHYTYNSGESGIFSVSYKLDRGQIHEGDFIYVNVPSDIAEKVDLQVSSQHFKTTENLGNGRYKLTFNKDAESAINGGFSMIVSFKSDQEITDKITVAEEAKEVTVLPGGSPSGGSGEFTDAIMKDIEYGDGITYGGYDYSEGYENHAAQEGIYSAGVTGAHFRLFVNRKGTEMTNIKVEDTLPAGMTFDKTREVRVTDYTTGNPIQSGCSLKTSGNKLIFDMDKADKAVRIDYWVNVSKEATSKYTNTAVIDYTANGERWKESRNYVLKGANYKASNGEKRASADYISDAPDEQIVTYSFKFWNDQGFGAGEIDLTDNLDQYIDYISAEDNEYFSVKQDESNPQRISIVNTKPIDGSTTTYVRFTCDFSRVPIGYTVENTVGGNVTKTKKIAGSASIRAIKTVNGKQPTLNDDIFSFTLTGEGQNQKKVNNADGNVLFDDIEYGKDDIGKTFIYTVKEVKPEGKSEYVYDNSEYKVEVIPRLSVEKDGTIETDTIIKKDGNKVESISFNNTKEIKKINVSGSKVWSDSDNNDNKRPESINIHLLKNGSEIDMKTVTEKDGWSWSFNNLDKYENGEVINYSITEDAVTGYSTTYNGYDVTNSYTPGKTSVTVCKSWDDNNNQDRIRPDHIDVQLLADGKAVENKKITLNEEKNWTDSFTNLPEYKGGKKIEYTIVESKVKGYESVVMGNAATGFNITNKHDPEKTKIEGHKIWNDEDNNYGKRPESINIHLLKNGSEIEAKTVTEKDEWSWSFNNLDKYENGEVINYSITEDAVTGYSTTYNGYDVTNSYTPGKTSVTVSKSWHDANDKDKIRPEKIRIQLLADGKKIDEKTIALTKKNHWTGSFVDLPEYQNGKRVKYTVDELNVEGYESIVSGSPENGFIITNFHNALSNTVQTGDSTNLIKYIIIMITAAALAFLLVLTRKNK